MIMIPFAWVILSIILGLPAVVNAQTATITTTTTATTTTLNNVRITNFIPKVGVYGTNVTIVGRGFLGVTDVKFNGKSATFTVANNFVIKATVPVSATTGPISVTTPIGTAVSATNFTLEPPIINNFAPKNRAVGTTVTVIGKWFTNTTDVKFNGTSATFTVANNFVIRATVPVGATTGPISVTTPIGTAISAGTFTINTTTTTTTSSTTTTTLPASLGLQTVATGLSLPLYLTEPPGDNDRLFIVEQTGTIRIVKNGTLLSTPFLDIHTLVSNGFEQGLLGLAFDPNYAMNGRFYISYTDTSGNSQIVRYLVSSNPDVAQTTPDRVLLSVDQPFDNHNGGDILFGPDGYLYIGLGDGGSGGDPLGNGQDLTDLLGSLLRIDVSQNGDYVIPSDNPFVNQAPARPELWNYGLRNPWRFSFDHQTGDLYIADVGQDRYEEVNVSLAASGGGKGLNYGWNIVEGLSCFNPSSNCNMSGLALPVLVYDHSNGCSVTGGYVYRGSAIPGIRGTYFYSDYCSGWVRSFVYQNGQAAHQTDWVSLRPGGNVTSFGEDTQGELYILTAQGGVYRIIAVP